MEHRNRRDLRDGVGAHQRRTGVYEITSGNYAAVDAYEPGSVGKVITIAGALNEGTVTPETTFVVPWRKAYTRRGDLPARLPRPRRRGDDASSRSSSSRRTSARSRSPRRWALEHQYHYMRAFGLGEETALDFPDETPASSSRGRTWGAPRSTRSPTARASRAARSSSSSAVNTIANDGTYVAPKLVRAPSTPTATVHEMPAVGDPRGRPARGRRADAADDARGRLPRAPAQAGQVPGLSIAGKTGTGFNAQPDGGYLYADGTKAYYASFVGFFPAEDPQVTILVSIDEPPADAATASAAPPPRRCSGSWRRR